MPAGKVSANLPHHRAIEQFYDDITKSPSKHFSKKSVREMDAERKIVEKRQLLVNQLKNLTSAAVGGEGATFNAPKNDHEAACKIAAGGNRVLVMPVLATSMFTTGTIGTVTKAARHLTKAQAKADPAIRGLRSAQTGVLYGYALMQFGHGVKQAYNSLYNFVADVKVNKGRTEFQRIIKDYDPVTGKFRDGEVLQDKKIVKAHLQELLSQQRKFRNTVAGDVARTKTQVLGDQVFIWNDMGARFSTCTAATVNATQQIVSTLMYVVPFLNMAVVATLAVQNSYRFGMHVTAMNNIYQADENITRRNIVLHQLAKGAISWRTVLARQRLAMAGAYTASTVSNAVAGAAAMGAPVGQVAVPLTSMVTNVAVIAALNYYQLRELHASGKIERARAASAAVAQEIWKNAPQTPAEHESETDLILRRQQYFQKILSTEKHPQAIAEILAIKMLRGRFLAERETTVNWLKTCGFAFNTICAMELEPFEKDALSRLRANLFNNKLTWIAANNRQGGKTFKRVFGIDTAQQKFRQWRTRRSVAA